MIPQTDCHVCNCSGIVEDFDGDRPCPRCQPPKEEHMTTPTNMLEPGQWVVASGPIGDDFGIPIVEPTHRQRRDRTVRQVRSVIRQGNGLVVRFDDGTKTRPLHGRTSWLTA